MQISNLSLDRVVAAQLTKKGIVPRKVMGLFNDYTPEELALIEEIELVGASSLKGIENLPNIKSISVRTNTNSERRKLGLPVVFDEFLPESARRASVDDNDIFKHLSKCKKLENINLSGQSKLTMFDAGDFPNLTSLKINDCKTLETITGLNKAPNLKNIEAVGNESLVNIDSLADIIETTTKHVETNLDVQLFPMAIGYKYGYHGQTINFKALENMKMDMGAHKWSEHTDVWCMDEQGNRVLDTINKTVDTKTMLSTHATLSNVIKNRFDPKMSAWEQIELAHLWTSKNIQYDRNVKNFDGNFLTGAVNGRGVCEGYTRTMQYLLKLVDIDTKNVTCLADFENGGKLNQLIASGDVDLKYKIANNWESGENGQPGFGRLLHSCIRVETPQGYYYCDPTWDKNLDLNSPMLPSFCILNKDEISKNHILGDETDVISAPSLWKTRPQEMAILTAHTKQALTENKAAQTEKY